MRVTGILYFAAAVLIAGCAVKGDPIEISKACVVPNDGKNFEVSGVISQSGSVYCSNTGGRMECGFDLLEKQGSENKLRIDIEQGSGANTVDKLGSGYKTEDIKIRDNSGKQIALDTDPVKLTGKLSVSPDAQACFMQVYKIEK
jgi:putative hemolysin